MKIKLDKVAEKLSAAVDGANGRATAHVFTPEDIVAMAATAERLLERHGVPKNLRKGCRILAKSGVPESKSYARRSFSAIATEVALERGAGAWYLVSVGRIERYTGPGAGERQDWHVPEHVKSAIFQNAMKDFK